jgi:predicted ribosome quality control (RQC) complex YloA/Tae2 family protein
VSNSPDIFLDSWLIARLARELNDLLAGSRVEDMVPTPGGLTLFCYRHGQTWGLEVELNRRVPVAWAGPGTVTEARRDQTQTWIGTAPALVRGAQVETVSVLSGDRVIVIDASSRSPFGLPSPTRLVLELQPGKANILVLRRSHRKNGQWVVVAVRKQFPAGTRRIVSAAPYNPPPAQQARLDRAQFILAAREVNPDDGAAWERLARAYDPLCSPPLAREVWWLCKGQAGQSSGRAHAWLSAWEHMRLALTELCARSGPLYVWRRGDELEAMHLIPLQWPAGERTEWESVNAFCGAVLRGSAAEKRRPPRDGREWEKRVAERIRRCMRDIQVLEESLTRCEDPEFFVRAGRAIYAHCARLARGSVELRTEDGLHVALDPERTPQENAAAYFVRYRKARSGRQAIQARLDAVRRDLEHWEQLSWDLQREDLTADERAAVLAEVALALGIVPISGRRHRASARRPVDLGDGAVAYVGRSSGDNDRLTFGFAAPGDFWFHARGVPGSHVIVKTSGGSLTEAQLLRAAVLAARHSRAGRDTAVDVDYTRRRYVRRRGKPGLVSYTHAQTIRVRPEGSP